MSFLLKYLFVLALLLYNFLCAASQTWCGKYYIAGQPIVPPGGCFPYTESSTAYLVAFRCIPAVNLYIEGESPHQNNASIILETKLVLRNVSNAFPLALSNAGPLTVIIRIADEEIGTLEVPLNSSKVEFSFPLKRLKARKMPYNIDCKVFNSVDTNPIFHSTTSLKYLPKPAAGSIIRLDHLTGALMAQGVMPGAYGLIFPIGFYTSFGGYLESNITILDDIKAQGFNIVHPVPPFDNLTALNNILDRMEELGLYLVYDTRHIYRNLAQLADEINVIKNRSCLLLWYTADEPDGAGEPVDSTVRAYNLINDLDGYHPIAIALNCDDYHFLEYSAGADIIMPDTYMIGNDVQFSSKYMTSCTRDFGCCGCDNCKGKFEDISERLDKFRDRLEILGWDRTKSVWFVPQAFGGNEFWLRPPTGREWLLQALVSINHGARGLMPWIDPTPADIKAYASSLALALPKMSKFFFHPKLSFEHFYRDGVDVGKWTIPSNTLIITANLNEFPISIQLPSVPQGILRWIVVDGVTTKSLRAGILAHEALGCAAFVVRYDLDIHQTTSDISEHDEL